MSDKKKGKRKKSHYQVIDTTPAPDIWVQSRDFVQPHDVAALVKLTEVGRGILIASLKMLKAGDEVSLGEPKGNEIAFQLRE